MKNFSALLLAGVTGCSNITYTEKDSTMIEVRQRLQNQIYYALFGDADKDSVSDYWDQCLHTPPNVKVSTHGCPLDTNGDGIPDYQEEIFGGLSDLNDAGATEEWNYSVTDTDLNCYQKDKQEFVSRCYGFAYDSDMVTEQMRHEIATLVEDINSQNDVVALEVIGHSDDRGGSDYNLALSKRRAQALATELRLVLRPEIEVLVYYKGEFEPLASNANPQGQILNRRVEINALYMPQD